MKKIIIALVFVGFNFISVSFPKTVMAACNFHSSMTAANKSLASWSSTCTISGVEGVDNPGNSETSTTNSAIITISGGAITINNGGFLKSGTINLSGGTIAVQAGGQLNTNSPLYVSDNDTDGWPANFTLYSASAGGKRRLGLMKSYTTLDCNDVNDFKLTNCCLAPEYCI